MLLQVAAELFTVQGYGITTTRTIAERAGMRQATRHHYFSGKDEISAALLEATAAASLARARGLLGTYAATWGCHEAALGPGRGRR